MTKLGDQIFATSGLVWASPEDWARLARLEVGLGSELAKLAVGSGLELGS